MMEHPVFANAQEEPPVPSQQIRRARMNFLLKVCGVPEEMILDTTWAEWQDVHGWNVMHFLAEGLNTQYLEPDDYAALEVDTFVWRFVRRGGDLNARVEPGPRAAGKTPLLMLCQVQTSKAARTESHERDVAGLAECLLKYGASPTKCMGHGNGRAPLHHALAHGRRLVVAAFIRYGASPYDMDDQGDTTVEVASRNHTVAGRQNLQDAISMFDARPRASSGARASGPPPKRARQIDDVDL